MALFLLDRRWIPRTSTNPNDEWSSGYLAKKKRTLLNQHGGQHFFVGVFATTRVNDSSMEGNILQEKFLYA